MVLYQGAKELVTWLVVSTRWICYTFHYIRLHPAMNNVCYNPCATVTLPYYLFASYVANRGTKGTIGN